MGEKKKFEGFRERMLAENEERYGAEIRKKYGNAAVDRSDRHIRGLSEAQYAEGERLRIAMEEALAAAFATGDPAGELAQKACDLHRQWLCAFYPAYSKPYHLGLADMYVEDARFRQNYDKIASGCTEFLRDAIHVYCRCEG